MLAAAFTAGCQNASPGDSLDRTATPIGGTFAPSDSLVVSIGGYDERPGYHLTSVVGALRLTDGTIVIADGTRQLKYYDAQGRHLRSVGGNGAGPGEFERLGGILRGRADSVVVWDRVADRLTVFSPVGDLASSSPIPALRTLLEQRQRGLSNDYVVGADVYPLGGQRLLIDPIISPEQTWDRGQDTLPLLVMHRSGGMPVEVGPFARHEWAVHEQVGMLLPFGGRFMYVAADSVIYAAHNTEPVIRVYSPETGEELRSFEIPLRRRVLDDVNRTEERTRYVASFIGSKEAMEAFFDAMPWPDSMPLFGRMRLRADGRLAIQAYVARTDSLQEWLVLDDHGGLASKVQLDAGVTLLDLADTHAVVTERDDLGVEVVRVHELVADGDESGAR